MAAEPPDPPAQIPLESLKGGSWDVVVVGAGPAGATAAFHLARGGLSVVLVDRAPFPRDKPCGDGLIADSLRCLGRMGLLEAARERAHRCGELSVYSPSRHEMRFRGEFLTLRRRDLDALVAGKAAEAGAAFAKGHVRALREGKDGVVAEADGAALRARAAVLATGARAELADGLGVPPPPRPKGVAARCYVRSSAALDRWIVSFDRSVVPGYAWVFPCGGGLFNVGCGAPYRPGAGRRLGLRGLFGNFTAGFPPAQEVLGKGEVVSPLRGAAVRAGLEGAPPLLGARILVAGETAGTTLPYTGEGIGKAMESGEIAARVLLEALGPGGLGRIADYPARIASELAPRYRGYRAAERWLSRPWIADLLARRTARSGYLTRATEGIFTESADPSEVFSLRGVLRSLWG